MLNGLNEFLGARMQALGLREQRSQVLASNIANADTPHYKARDFDFASALRGAQGARMQIELARTSARHLSEPRGSSLPVDLKYRVPVQGSIDGNTVELDTELAQFSDNALRMQADITFLSHRLRGLQTAITGQ